MWRDPLVLYQLSATILSVCALLDTDISEHQSRRSIPIRLRPIHLDNYEAALGFDRRSVKEFSDLDLQAQAEFIYGSPGGRTPLGERYKRH